MSDVIYSPSTNHSSGPGAVGSSLSAPSGSGSSSVINSASHVNFVNHNDDYYDFDLMSPNYSDTLATFHNAWSNQIDRNNRLFSEAAVSANEFQEFLQRQSQTFNSLEANKNRQWQEYMSNTAHQREVQDLINAGLNPVLSAMNGVGATTPSGSSASSGQGSSKMAGVDDTNFFSSLMNILGVVISSAFQYQVATNHDDTSLKVAKVNSEATHYAADKSSFTNLNKSEVGNTVNNLMGALFYGKDYFDKLFNPNK